MPRVTRTRWLVAGGVAVLVAAGVLAVTAGRSLWEVGCDRALPQEADPVHGPRYFWVVRPDALEQGMLDRAPYKYEGAADFPFDRLATAIGGEDAPFGEPRHAITKDLHGGRRAAPSGEAGVLVPYRVGGVVVVPDVTGEAAWWQDAPGFQHAALATGDRVALVHDAPVRRGRERLAVTAVDPADGSRQACAWLGPAFDGPGDRHPSDWYDQRKAALAATATGAGEVAVVRAHGQEFRMSVVDIQAGEVRADVATDLPALPRDLRAAGEVVVASAAEDRSAGQHQIPPFLRDAGEVPAERLPLRAYRAGAGTPAWTYTAAPGDGDPYAHRIIGTTDELVVVHAARWRDEIGEFARSTGHLVALDAATGRAQWRHRRAADPGPADARVYGDRVLAVEPDPDAPDDPQRRWLVGYDLENGEERWRVPDPAAAGRLDRGAVLDDAAAVLLPAPDEQGLVAVDLATGQSRTYFDGVTVSRVIASGAVIGVAFSFDTVVDSPETLVLHERVPGSI